MIRSSWKNVLVALACLGMMAPQPTAFSADPTGEMRVGEPTLLDVTIGEKGLLRGRLVDEQGRPLKDTPVSVRHNGQSIVLTETGTDGTFVVQGLRCGVHELVTPVSLTACRFWTADLAPPSAVVTPVIVADSRVIRGQACGEECGEGCGEGFLGNNGGMGSMLPWLGVGAVVAIVLATTLDDDDAAAAAPPASP